MGRTKLSIETGCKHTHFTWEERLSLQNHYTGTNNYKKNTSPTILGTLLSKHERTIRRDLKRGMVEHLKSDLSTVMEYNAEYAQNEADSKNSAKGPQPKLGKDWGLANKASELIKEKNYSPYAVIQYFENNEWPSSTRICEKTLYSYIYAGDIPDVSEKDLLYEGRRRKPKSQPKRHSRAQNAAKNITKRPQEANDRSERGHWELDTVYSGKECSSRCLLVFTERKYRVEIIRAIADRTAASVKAEMDKIERQMGASTFRELFKSITVDNGSEFSDVDGIEGSVLNKGLRTELFFAHPYSSFERGTNENHNGIIRRFIPKGSDIGNWTKKSIRKIQNYMNSYPRKILGGMTPFDALSDEMRSTFTILKILEVNS